MLLTKSEWIFAYHAKWGDARHDQRVLFEFLTEGAQAGMTGRQSSEEAQYQPRVTTLRPKKVLDVESERPVPRIGDRADRLKIASTGFERTAFLRSRWSSDSRAILALVAAAQANQAIGGSGPLAHRGSNALRKDLRPRRVRGSTIC